MTAQQVLFWAYRRGVKIGLNGTGGLRLTPAAKVTPGMIAAVRSHKPALLALVADLERYWVADDPFIQEALALFNGSLKGWRTAPTVPLKRTRMPQDCAAKPGAQAWLQM